MLYCRSRTLRGGRGVDDASHVREYRCAHAPGHTGPCTYTREIGMPRTAEAAAGAEDAHGANSDRTTMAMAIGVLPEVEGLPEPTKHRLRRQAEAVEEVWRMFGPREEVRALARRVTREVTHWTRDGV